MIFYLAKGNEKRGPFTRYQVIEKLASGEYTPDDLGWHDELDGWLPLKEIPATATILEGMVAPKDAPAQGAVPVPGPVPAQELDGPQVRPFVRFFARFLDLFVFSSLVWILAGGQSLPDPPRTPEEVGPFLIDARRILLMEAAILFAWNFADAWLLSTYGTTLGKWLLSIEVRTSEGAFPTYQTALRRSFHIWRSGYAFGLPILRELIKIVCLLRLVKEGVTPWDRALQLRVVHRPVNEMRVAIAVLIFLAAAVAVNLFATAGPG